MSIFLSIGTNEGNRKENIRKALCELTKFCKILKISKFYKTIPYGYKDQKNFINFALEIETKFSPFEFLKVCQNIELKLGRKREIKWGPRTIDIDILFWNDSIIDTEELKIPHYDLPNREFVLKPLLDLDPYFIHPVSGKNIETLYNELKEKMVIFKN